MQPPTSSRPARLALGASLLGLAGGLAALLGSGGVRSLRVGGADAANTLVVAKNLLAGRGFSVDHLIYYAVPYPTISHAEDAYPLLHPALVAALSWLTRDVFVAGHLLQSLFLFAYVGVLPLVALRRHGVLPALTLAIGLLALEHHTLFDVTLNDGGAMVLFAAAALELARAHELGEGPRSTAAFVRGAVLAVAAVSFKASLLFFVAALVAALVLGYGPTLKRTRWQRAAWVFALIGLASVPTLLWYRRAHGEFGLPQAALMRNFARSIATESDFLAAWERSRTYLPAHPERVLPFRRVLEEHGYFFGLIQAPAARAWHGLREGFLSGGVVPLPWLLALAVSAKVSRRPNAFTRIVLCGALASLLIPAYSHYEPRYLQPLRPLLALAAMHAVAHLAGSLEPTLRARVERVALALGLVLVGVGWFGTRALFGWAADLSALLVCLGGVYFLLGRAQEASAERGLALRELAAAGLIVGTLGLGFVTRLPAGVAAILQTGARSPNPEAALGRFVAEHVPPGGALMARRQAAVSLFSERPTIVTPFDTEDVCAAARQYRVGWLLVGDPEDERQAGLTAFADGLPLVARHADYRLFQLDCGP